MNKRQARQIALKIAVDLLSQEIDMPSEIGLPYITDQEEADGTSKIYDALENLMLNLDAKVVRGDA